MERILLPTKQDLLNDSRSIIISIAGKIFHLFFSGGDKSLGRTAEGYLKKTHTTVCIEESSIKAINDLKEVGKGIIILNHKSGIFSDYLPLLPKLGDDIINKCIFYTGQYNKPMNEREFPNNKFRPATLSKREDAKEIKNNIENDVAKIEKDGGYIFIIPSGANTSEDAEFQAIFQKMIKKVDSNMPILVNRVEHDGDMSYGGIVESIKKGTGGTTTIASKLQQAGDRKDLTGEQMRKKYNQDMI